MNKLQYLKFAINNNLYKKKTWMISAFAIIKENINNKENIFLGSLVLESWGYSFYNEKQELVKIEDSIPNEPLFKFLDPITIDNTWIENADKSINTFIGNLLVNKILVTNCFGNKIKFIEGKISIKDIEEKIAKSLIDNPKNKDEKRLANFFYVDEYVKFIDNIQYLSTFTQLATYSATKKNILPPTGIKEFKKELLEKYKDKLNNPVELSNFEQELKNFDSNYLEGDPSNNIFVSGKVKNVARKKMFLTIGSEQGFDEDLKSEPIINSLDEGWPTDPVKFTELMNGLRIGSFSRGAETVKGGVSAKVLLRAITNFNIQDTDCGSKLGIRRKYTKENINKLVGRYIIDKEVIFIDNEDLASKFIDKNIIIRSPMYCKLEGENICKICSGNNLFQFKEGLAIPVTEISSIILTTSLRKMHGTILSTAKLDIEEIFS
jgi:hypothetical protein